VVADRGEQHRDLAQLVEDLGILDRTHAETRVALDQALEHAPEEGGVATEAVGRHGRALPAGDHLVDVVLDALAEHELAGGDVDLVAGGALLDQQAHHLVGKGQQLRHQLVDGADELADLEDGLLVALVLRLGGLLAPARVLQELPAHQAEHQVRVALLEHLEVALEAVAGLGQPLEGRLGARGRLQGVLGDVLGKHALLAGDADVLPVIAARDRHVDEDARRRAGRAPAADSFGSLCPLRQARRTSPRPRLSPPPGASSK